VKKIAFKRSPTIFTYYLQIKESDIFIKSDISNSLDLAKEVVIKHRNDLENYINDHKDFETSLKPIKISENAPEIVKRMTEVTSFIEVGPMASVAGALADVIIERLKKEGTKTSIVENGGEISAVANKTIIVGIFAGNSPLSGKIGFKLKPNKDFPFGLGTSSGTFGRGFSFGSADAATVISTNATIADAAATFVGNHVKGNDLEKSIQKGLEAAESLENVRGAFIIRGKYAGMTGSIPELVKLTGNTNQLLKRRYQYSLDQDYKIL